MMTTGTEHKNVHQGRNVRRFREMMGLKQDALAWKLGEDWSQQRISLLEQKETIDDLSLLNRISEILNVPVEALQNFDEEQPVNIFSNTFHKEAFIANTNSTFNVHPVDKLIELHEQKIALYERMLKEKDEMMQRLNELIKNLSK